MTGGVVARTRTAGFQVGMRRTLPISLEDAWRRGGGGRMRQAALLAACALLALTAPAEGRAQSSAPPAYRLSLRAQLFYSGSGTFSPDLIAHPVELWNTPAGEGRAGGASSATLVVAVMRGEAGSYVPTRKVELTVTSGGREVFRRAEETGIINTEGRTYVAFWLYGTGCRRIRLSARIQGQEPSTPANATIPFACGE